ncbi:MAG: hypothetical protein IPM74_12315 [Crocinitomicaceae bacterium]|nr:hypothetical protein [Crocinitomicaceae bacterium]MBK8926659.1 hypothetical protein [Crocinitomicaceae bacterium]
MKNKEFIQAHLVESKKQISELADRIMLNDADLEDDKRLFAPILQKTENIILSDYLIELANKRIEDLEVYIGDTPESQEYADQLTVYLQYLLREKL